MTDRHPAWVLLDKIQMDARALDRNIQSLRMEFAAVELPDKPPPLPVYTRIALQIRNGVLRDEVDLEAELNGFVELSVEERGDLRAMLTERTTS